MAPGPYNPFMTHGWQPDRQTDQGRAAADLDDTWYRRAFDRFYLELYAGRDEGEAERLAAALGRYGRGGPILEVACGAGRFLRALRATGREVCGLDLSSALLAEARRQSPGQPLVRGDMRLLPFADARFEMVLFLFTSFGYFRDRNEDRRVLREARRVVSAGGFLVLDFLNAPRVRAGLVAESRREVAGRAVRETRWIEEEGPFLRKRVEIGLLPAGGPEPPGMPGSEIREERVRLYDPPDLEHLARSTGFEPTTTWGDYDGRSFDPAGSDRFVLVAEAVTP